MTSNLLTFEFDTIKTHLLALNIYKLFRLTQLIINLLHQVNIWEEYTGMFKKHVQYTMRDFHGWTEHDAEILNIHLRLRAL